MTTEQKILAVLLILAPLVALIVWDALARSGKKPVLFNASKAWRVA